MSNPISGAVDTSNINQDRRTYGRGKMSFKSIQKGMAKKQGISMKRAGAMLASGTRRAMQQHGMSTKHGIPKNVFSKHAFKKGSPNKAVGNHCLRAVGALE